ncbi:hypothetical protein INR75_00755 [Zunongwangia sp. SCSIO 43204]|uniref:hypothetical protein n=1 Tax=Zunongwangia sp. SCSIO 43204 TaxID=2779359 RepID=UPI001CAA406C|nr:hypothetical protein [Zunongwangia sp. SCSIO 43204]UAB84601.1 hypothetical protein INR75_00755 [Zunongwangia sp. SCSIO 43204]
MAPIKFEDHIKEQLEERRISPSASGWEKLNARLDENENRQKSNKKWWLGIAALLVIAVAVGGFMLKSENGTIEEQIVDTPSEKTSEEITKPVENSGIPSEEKDNNSAIAAEEVKEEIKEETEKTEPEIIQNQLKKDSKKIIPAHNEIGIATIDVQEVKTETSEQIVPKIDKINPNFINPTKTEEDFIAQNENLIQTKLEEVIRSLEANSEDSVSDAEVNALLLAAASDLDQDYQKEFANPYSAEALLAEAEHEIEKSFRDKIFQLLKEGYSKAKNAVALD